MAEVVPSNWQIDVLCHHPEEVNDQGLLHFKARGWRIHAGYKLGCEREEITWGKKAQQ